MENIKVLFKPGEYVVELHKGLTQYDHGQVLEIHGLNLPDALEVDFSIYESGHSALPMVATTTNKITTVNIPDELLNDESIYYNYTIYAYVYLVDEDSARTEYRVLIPVNSRSKPDEEADITEEEQTVLEQAIVAINTAVENKLDKYQGAEYSGKAMVVDSKGKIVPGDLSLDGVMRMENLEMDTVANSGSVTLYLGDGQTEKRVNIPIPVDSVLSAESTNPVANNVIAQEISAINEEIELIKNEGVGGGDASSTVRLTNQNGSGSLIFSYNSAAPLMFTFTSLEADLPTGDGVCKITVNGALKSTMSIPQGLNAIDVSQYLTIGTNTVVVSVTDVYGKTRSLSYTITIIQLTIDSTFDATVTYNNDITYKYIAYGAIEKTIHFLIDGTEVGTVITSLSGKQATRIIPKMSHGVHRFEVYSTAAMDETSLESPHLVYDIMCVEDGATSPMIASVYTTTALSQGEQVAIPYIVYDPTKLACDITLTVYTLSNGSEVVYSTQDITVDRSQQHWYTRRYPVGTVYFRIKYGDISKTHSVTVEESKIKIEAETNDLELYLAAEGRSNNETNPAVWAYGDVSTTFSGVNWSSTGWINDENGDTCLRLNGDATAEISFQPFSEDLRTYGKTLELEFTIRDVNNRDAIPISCMSGGLGFQVKPDTAYLRSEQSEVFCNYKEDERVRLSFVIESKAEYRMLSVYLNGVMSDAIQYPNTDNFQQTAPVNITIGSPYCGIDVYTIRSYSTALPDSAIVTNFIADMSDVVRKTEVYEDNDIYDDYGNVSFQKAKEKNCVMVIVGDLPKSKGDKKNVTVYYYDVEDSNLDYVEENVVIDVQG